MARVPTDHRPTPLLRVLRRYARRAYGDVPEPGLVAYHHRGVLFAMLARERRAARWHALDPTLKTLAVMVSSGVIGCRWCLDFGYWEASEQGIDPQRLRAVPQWRDSEVFTDLERDVMAYAEAMTVTPPTVDDAMVAGLRVALGDRALVELTAMVAIENDRSRTNAAMGLTSQGFSDRCELRPA